MANDKISYLKDSGRFPKTNVEAVEVPTAQLTNVEWNKAVGALEDLESANAQTAASVSTLQSSVSTLSGKVTALESNSGSTDHPVSTGNNSSYNWAVVDANGYMPFCVQNGYPKTKNFDGANVYNKSQVDALIASAGGSGSGSSGTTTVTETRKHLRILFIGNSYSLDSVQYVPFILKNYGITCEMGIFYVASTYLEWHVTNWSTNTASSWLQFINTQTQTAWSKVQTGKSAASAVAYGHWDIISIQQASTQSVTYSTYVPHARNLINKILDSVSYPVKIGWLININRAAAGDGQTYENQILTNVSNICNREPVNIVFPYGTAIFNARTNSTLAALGEGTKLWCSDQTHLQEGLPCYIAACAIAQTLFETFYPEFSILGDKTRPTSSNVSAWNVQETNGSVIGLTDANCRLAQTCAILANKNKFSITTIYG